MDITHLGHASFKIRGKQVSLVTDPFSPAATGLKFPKNLEADIVTISHQHEDHNYLEAGSWKLETGTLIISGPGEYESKGVKILGISSFHDSSAGSERGRNTIYKITMDGITLCHLGDLGHKLEDKQLDLLDGIDLLMIPVGGVFTIDAKSAAEVVAQLEPIMVIPMHYQAAGLKFQLETVEKFLQEMGKPEIKPMPKLTISKEKLPEEMEIVVLE